MCYGEIIMIVTFISQCEKKALTKTRRILDTFAERIGNCAWQTVITNEGVNAVKKLLRKTASKNTAVSCHWIKGRVRSELIWVVGNRDRFDSQGIVPVHYTNNNNLNKICENDWHYLPTIKALVALAALLHDWGKSSKFFQNKLCKKSRKPIGDPLRHEWISCLLLQAFVSNDDDERWLTRLAKGDINEEDLKKVVAKNRKEPLADLPPAAGLVAWLILSHHRLPLIKDTTWKGESAETLQKTLKRITQEWGYENKNNEEEYDACLYHCLEFPNNLCCNSTKWLKLLKKWATKTLDQLPLINVFLKNGAWRILLYHARLSLMLGDHLYSSQEANTNWQSNTILLANTDRQTGKPKQKLDEHLVGVTRSALNAAHLLPSFEGTLPVVKDILALRKKSPPAFKWQDKAVDKIQIWKKQLPKIYDERKQGFFAVNMASTGCGKTFANAKIMRALSFDSDSLRYVLALGLRTLTLQTGEEYRHRIGLDESELAVLIGSKAIMELHQQKNPLIQKGQTNNDEQTGSESLEALLDEDIHYDCDIPGNVLTTVLKSERDIKFLYAPVLACTIDHIITATETKRGGRYILPSLRLMTSDLVIDEVDDFDGEDLIAIGRLIHLAGMLGRKVMISSATIPPNLAEGYFNAYREGWLLFSKTREASYNIGCAWIDEFNTKVYSVNEVFSAAACNSFKDLHNQFINHRVQKLQQQSIKRKGEIIYCGELLSNNKNANDDFIGIDQKTEQSYFKLIKQAIILKHEQHFTEDSLTCKLVSFGVVRVARIQTCIDLSRYLITSEWPESFASKILAYHSRQVLLLRNEQEKHLDSVLIRKEKSDGQPMCFSNPIIRQHLDTSEAPNIIFILVATPVEEVGRDHDFDWAIIEPSSYRSIIQLAGRVRRHRTTSIDIPNISLMQYNLESIMNGTEKPAYHRPGYESSQNKLKTHDMRKLIDESVISHSINAIPRIKRNKQLNPEEKLDDLEHHVIMDLLTNYNKIGPESMHGWLIQHWWLTAMPQYFVQFRRGLSNIKIYLVCQNDELKFYEKDRNGSIGAVEELYNINHDDTDIVNVNRLWLVRNYSQLLEQVAELQGISMYKASLKYGEICIPNYGADRGCFEYSDQFGMRKTKK